MKVGAKAALAVISAGVLMASGISAAFAGSGHHHHRGRNIGIGLGVAAAAIAVGAAAASANDGARQCRRWDRLCDDGERWACRKLAKYCD